MMFTNRTDKEENRRLLRSNKNPEYTEPINGHRQQVRSRSTLVEPVMFIFVMAKTLSDSVITNLLEYRVCQVELGLPEANCSDPITSRVEDMVQPTTAQIIMGRALLEAFIPSCLTVLIGPWSDANGRTPFMVIALGGMSLAYLCWGFLALLPNLNPFLFLLASLPLSGSGGSWALYMLSYCYVSDVTDERARSFRMSVLTMAIYCSLIFGSALAPVLIAVQHSLNPYPLIFFFSASLLIICTLYTHWYLRESINIDLGGEKAFFKWSHVKDSFLTCFQRRSGHARAMIFLIMASLSINVFISEGEGAVMYLSLREMFSWQLSDFSTFSCFANVTSGLGAFAGVWLFASLLGLSNMLVVVLLFIFRTARSLIFVFARSGLDFYIGAAVATFVSAYSALCRTEISRMVPRPDLGKVFALMSFLESLTPIASTPLYTLVYQLTFLEYPGAVYIFSTALCVVALILATIVFILQRIVRGDCYCPDLTRDSHVQTID
ncbi:proton-coupled folate transporter-like [Homalodisca vitripennis]|uniref:proton-coupled folate transporter-like n=1 Tax=Homalodisca vitripennis TaxID=197043 RepID=UPI001EEB524D|nr:proton-coupled folate transporter-like [Homalodisca vitripennis]